MLSGIKKSYKIGEKIPIAIRKIRDSRPDISKIGVKKNTIGMEMGKVDLKKGVIFLDVFTKKSVLEEELESMNYKG